MDVRTGNVYERLETESLAQMAERLKVPEGALVPLDKAPDSSCPICQGRGSVPKGLGSRRFKPCRCTYPPSKQ